MLTLVLDGKLFLAPIGPTPQVHLLFSHSVSYHTSLFLSVCKDTNSRQKVLDVGTGTGIWAL
jgi:methylase of polypeptide subunit release factors